MNQFYNANTVRAIYSPQCAKHKELYIGQIIQSLNERFNDHLSNVAQHLDRSDLAQSIIIKTTMTSEHVKDL